MSALFKLVLGQKVVHPDNSKEKADIYSQTNGDATMRPGSFSAAAYNGNESTPGQSDDARRLASVDTTAHGPVTSDRRNGEPVAKVGASGPKSIAASPPALKPSLPPPAPNAPNSPRPSTPTRTLLLRIEGCTVAQDIREALRDLLRCPDLPYALDETSLKSLTSLLTSYAEDESITEPTLHLLANATDIDAYPSQLESNRRTIEVTVADKRHMRDAVLQGLVDAVALLLESMNAAAPFWSRYYAVVLLQRLEEFEPSKVNQALLEARGVGVLLDALNETDNDNALRNQALLLLTSLTLADRELQTLLAFDNAFDSLFDLVQREGGVVGGGVVVRDSLTVVQYILRSNKATQKLFREMGCAARLAALFDTIPLELSACTFAEQRRASAAPPSPSHWPQPTVLSDKLDVLLERLKSPDVMLNILMSVSILTCVLRGNEESEEEFHATQDALLRCGLLNPLTRLAFCGLAIDDATRIEAVRALALLLDRSERAMEEWLSAPPMMTLMRTTLPYSVRVWPAPRALLSYVCETTDTTLVNAGVQLFLSILSVPACQERVVGVFLGGLVGSSDLTGFGAASSGAKPSLTSNNGTNNSTDARGSNSLTDPQCGSALARILLSPTTSAVEKYYTAQVFRNLISLPAFAGLSESLVCVAVPAALQESKLDRFVNAQPGWVLSTHIAPSFFNYYVSFLLFALSGGAASQQMNTSALGAYVAALLMWTEVCPLASAALVQEITWGDTLLHQVRRDGAAHLKLWSSILIARSCVGVRAAAVATADTSMSHSKESATAAASTDLVQHFLQTVGGGAALDTILFDVQASTPAWQHPVTSGLRTQTPTPYDEPFVAQAEQLVREFKLLLSAAASASPNNASSASLPPLKNLNSPPTAVQSQPTTSPPPPYAPPLPHEMQRPVSTGHPPRVALSGGYATPNASVLSQTLPELSSIVAHNDYKHNNNDVSAAAAEPSTETLAFTHTLQAQLQDALAERERLAQEADQWRLRAERSEAQCLLLQQDNAARAAALEAVEAELKHQREAATAAVQASTVSSEVVDGLRENIHLLEEALSSKDEEHQQLVESLNMMEEQLRHATSAVATANEQRATAVAAVAEQQHQLQQLRSQQELQQQQQLQALPPSPPVGPQAPPPELLAEMEAERSRLQRELDSAQQEAGRLQRALQNLMSDYHDLLVMVAELNEECVSVKAFSSTAPTPARQLTDWPSTNPSVERDYETGPRAGEGAEVTLYEAPSLKNAVPGEYAAAEGSTDCGVPAPSHAATPLFSADHKHNLEGSLAMEGEQRQWSVIKSPSTQLRDFVCTTSSMAYKEAIGVLPDPTFSEPLPPLTVTHQHDSSGNETQCLQQQQGSDFRTSSQHMFPQHNLQQPQHRQQHQVQPPPLPLPPSAAPRSHEYGGLPNPLQTHQPALQPGARHAPRYADPSTNFFNVGATAQPPICSALPSPSPPQVPQSLPQSMPTGDKGSVRSSHLSISTHDSPPAYYVSTPAPPAPSLHEQQEQYARGVSQLSHHTGKGEAESYANHGGLEPLVRATVAVQLPPQTQCREIHTGEMFEQASPQAAQSEGNDARHETPPLLPYVDDFFGGGVGDGQLWHETNAAATCKHEGQLNPRAPVATTQPLPLQPEEAVTAPQSAMAFNPFVTSSSSTHSDQLAARTAGTTSDRKAEGHFPLPTATTTAHSAARSPFLEMKELPGSLPLKSDHSQGAEVALAPPPPPPPSMLHKHPVSALAGSAHHLNYKSGVTQAPPVSVSERNGGVFNVVPAPPPAASIQQLYEKEEKPMQSPPPAVTAYNPFVDFHSGEDENDGFADLQ